MCKDSSVENKGGRGTNGLVRRSGVGRELRNAGGGRDPRRAKKGMKQGIGPENKKILLMAAPKTRSFFCHASHRIHNGLYVLLFAFLHISSPFTLHSLPPIGSCLWGVGGFPRSLDTSHSRVELRFYFTANLFRVPEQHLGLGVEEHGVVHPSVTAAPAALNDDNLVRLPYQTDRHASDR